MTNVGRLEQNGRRRLEQQRAGINSVCRSQCGQRIVERDLQFCRHLHGIIRHSCRACLTHSGLWLYSSKTACSLPKS